MIFIIRGTISDYSVKILKTNKINHIIPYQYHNQLQDWLLVLAGRSSSHGEDGMDVQVPVKSGKTVHVNKNYAIELKSQNFAIKVKNTKITEILSSFQ